MLEGLGLNLLCVPNVVIYVKYLSIYYIRGMEQKNESVVW